MGSFIQLSFIDHLLCAIYCAGESKLNKLQPQLLKISLASRHSDQQEAECSKRGKDSTGPMSSRKGVFVVQ